MEPGVNTQRDAIEDALRDAAHDAFMAFWRGDACEQAALWAAYCAAQARYEVFLLQTLQRPGDERDLKQLARSAQKLGFTVTAVPATASESPPEPRGDGSF